MEVTAMENRESGATVPIAARRRIALRRTSRETDISLCLDLDGNGGPVLVETGIGFLDHLLTSLATHAGWSLGLSCRGDLKVDDHHSAEDCAILLGAAFSRIAGKRGKINRFGYAYAPMDESLARAVVDISGRPYCLAELGLTQGRIGELACENIVHVVESFAFSARINLHLDLIRGKNDHHRAEAAFKALALALRAALAPVQPESAIQGRTSSGAEAGGSFTSTKGGVVLEETDPETWSPLSGGRG